MRAWLKRLRGALGISALGAAAFHLIGWGIVAFESVLAGTLPSLGVILRMSAFTLPVGAFVGLLTAGAISIGGRWTHAISKGRAFVLGLPLGAVGGFLLSLTAGGLGARELIVNAAVFGLGTAALGAGAVAVAETATEGPTLEDGAGGRDRIAPPSVST